jgi:hypothetical protein
LQRNRPGSGPGKNADQADNIFKGAAFPCFICQSRINAVYSMKIIYVGKNLLEIFSGWEIGDFPETDYKIKSPLRS